MTASQTQLQTQRRANWADQYAQQSAKLSREQSAAASQNGDRGHAVDAKFVTPLDPVIQTESGDRLPAVPVAEAHKINLLKDRLEGRKARRAFLRHRGFSRFDRVVDDRQAAQRDDAGDGHTDDNLGEALPPSRTHPLFPPLPLYGPPSKLRDVQCMFLRTTSAFLSTCFLLVIVLGSLFTSILPAIVWFWHWLTFRDVHQRRPHHDEEERRAHVRKKEELSWKKRRRKRPSERPDQTVSVDKPSGAGESPKTYAPTEGGPDPLVCDAQYYARRVGLDLEKFHVQTEDGFIVELWHVFDPREYDAAPARKRQHSSPEVFQHGTGSQHSTVKRQYRDGQRRYPVLLMHGLLQSAGAYCCNDDDSLAFYLCKAGYDVWLGNNRCGFDPTHSLLKYSDPRMWAWNIRQMGVMDLPAFVSRVLEETGFERVGLVCHSQGTTQTFVALAKEQRPELGEKISVFCALAPAVYAGPLIGKMYFKFMRVISPAMFRIFFGIHAFIPLMMTMHATLPGKLYGAMGYRVFSFLFDWTDQRWDRNLRDRFFQFSPVYVSAESMRWWLGRECFAKHKCVLSTKEIEDVEDTGDDSVDSDTEHHHPQAKARAAWYDEHAPPMAFWIAGCDALVDGDRLLRRFDQGREPNVDLVHTKVIPDYQHLDVLWAIDAIEQVGREVKEVIWRCMSDAERKLCRPVIGTGIALDAAEGPEATVADEQSS